LILDSGGECSPQAALCHKRTQPACQGVLCCQAVRSPGCDELSRLRTAGAPPACLLLQAGQRSALGGLLRADCLPTTYSANKGPAGDVRGAAAQCLGKLMCSLQSKRTLIWTNTAGAWDMGQIKLQGSVDVDISTGPSEEMGVAGEHRSPNPPPCSKT
jgi:hypothetical protein